MTLLVSLLLIPVAASAADVIPAKHAPGKDPVLVNGDVVEYFEDEHKAVASGNVVITYQDSTLTCDKATVWTDTKDAEAEGHVQITRGENVLSGDRLVYNFETERGTILAARGSASPWFMGAPQMQKEGRNLYTAKNAWISTCDRFEPHYRIRASKVELYPENKVIARNAVLYFFNIPVAYFPYYDHSLKEKQNNWSVTPGKNKDWGFFVLSKYHYTLGERLKGRIHLDTRQKRGFAPGIDVLYDASPYGQGAFRFYSLQDQDKHRQEIARDRRNRYRFQVRHQWQLGYKTFINGEFHKTSDKDFIKDFFYREEFERDPNPQSYLNIVHSEPNFTVTGTALKRFNKFESMTERLPEVKFDAKPLRLGKSQFYFEPDVAIANLARRQASSAEHNDTVRLDMTNKLSYRMKLLGWLDVTPFAGYRNTAYSRTEDEEAGRLRNQFQTGVRLSSRFFKIYDVRGKILGTEFDRILHVIHPVLGYEYAPRPTVPRTKLIQYDEVDAIDRTNRFVLALEQNWQTKWKNKEGVVSTVDLARFVVSTNYLYREQKRGRWDKIKFDLELQPTNWLYFETNAEANPQRLSVDVWNFDVTAGKKEKWQLDLGHRFDLPNKSSQLTTGGFVRVLKGTKLRGYLRKEFRTEAPFVGEREFAIIQDLHCWEAELGFNDAGPQGRTAFIAFRLKAFPDIGVDLRKSFPRTPRSTVSPQAGTLP